MKFEISYEVNGIKIDNYSIIEYSIDEILAVKKVKEIFHSLPEYKKSSKVKCEIFYISHLSSDFKPDEYYFSNRITKIVETDKELVAYNSIEKIIYRQKYTSEYYDGPDEYGNKIHMQLKDDFKEWYTYDIEGRLIHYKNNNNFDCRYGYNDDGYLIYYRNSKGIIIEFDFSSNGAKKIFIHKISNTKTLEDSFEETDLCDILNDPDKVDKLIENNGRVVL